MTIVYIMNICQYLIDKKSPKQVRGKIINNKLYKPFHFNNNSSRKFLYEYDLYLESAAKGQSKLHWEENLKKSRKAYTIKATASSSSHALKNLIFLKRFAVFVTGILAAMGYKNLIFPRGVSTKVPFRTWVIYPHTF